MSTVPISIPSTGKNVLLNALRAALLGSVLVVLALAALVAAFELAYLGRVYPGVSVAGVDLSGLKPGVATAQIARQLDYPARGRILFVDGKRSWAIPPAELGFFVDPETTASAAYGVGRTGSLPQRLTDQVHAWFSGRSLPVTLVFDQRMAQRSLLAIAKEVDTPVIEASLGLNGVDVEVHSGQVGRSLDVAATLARLNPQLYKLQDGIVNLSIKETPPVILDASAQAELAKRILSDKLTLTLPDAQQGDPGPWVFEPPALAQMLTIDKVSNGSTSTYQVVLQPDTLRAYLTQLAPSLSRQQKNAKFRFNDDTDQIEVTEHGAIGRELDVEATVQAINQKLGAGEHQVPLVFKTTPPPAGDDATAEKLGIKQLIHTETSYYYGSAAARVQNIATAAKQFNGVLVAPGEVFSMGQTLGDVSLDNGYAEGLIIYGNQTIKGVGGGVCQVSTTLFRAAFFSGFPIVERYSHAYRVTYYEKVRGGGVDPKLAGLDATVYFPDVDFKFKNDTPYWILMETEVDPAASSITWKFYSTPDGRTVDWTTTGLVNITQPPEPLYQENPKLDKGDIKQVDWAVEGADVVVNRTVSRDGAVILQDTVRTHYMPWRSIFEYGPGTEDIPTPSAPTETPTP